MQALLTAKMEQHSQQDPLSTGARRAQEGEVDETLWYARSCTCGTIIDVLSALDVAPAKGGVGPQAAVEISEEAGMQIRVLEGTHSPSTLPSWHLARHSATPPQATQATRALGSARGAPHRGARTRGQALALRTPWGHTLHGAKPGVTPGLRPPWRHPCGPSTLHGAHHPAGATLHGSASLKPSLFEEWTCTFAEQVGLSHPALSHPAPLARSRSGRPSPDRPTTQHFPIPTLTTCACTCRPGR